jgi:hypothetical protein
MPESVIDGRNRKWLFRQLDSGSQTRAFTCANPVANELWVCFPELNQEFCTLALVWNWKYNTWGVRELPGVFHGTAGSIDYTPANTWDTYTQQWFGLGLTWQQNLTTLPTTAAMLASPQNSKFYSIEVGTTFDGENYESYILRENMRFDRPNTVKFLRQVRPLVEGPTGASIDIYIAAGYDQTADPTWYGPYPFRIGVDQKIDCTITGRMFGFKFAATNDFPWRLKRYDLDIEEIGLF